MRSVNAVVVLPQAATTSEATATASSGGEGASYARRPDHDPCPMSRLAKILALGTAAIAVVAITAACGTQRIAVPKSEAQLHSGAELFQQRCAGCHTLSYAAANGSAPNIRTGAGHQRPELQRSAASARVDRVLYAIENGGFSGAYMPQNVVVGQDAVDGGRSSSPPMPDARRPR